jgi:hypothetical protein
MNIDEAIKDFRYDAENNRADLDLEFAKENEQVAKWLTKLKAYADLEEQGRLIKLPCKVGDTVYCIEDKRVWNCIVEKISISRTNSATIEVTFPIETPDIAAIEYEIDDFGEYIFLTKSKAEAKLKELRGKNE